MRMFAGPGQHPPPRPTRPPNGGWGGGRRNPLERTGGGPGTASGPRTRTSWNYIFFFFFFDKTQPASPRKEWGRVGSKSLELAYRFCPTAPSGGNVEDFFLWNSRNFDFFASPFKLAKTPHGESHKR